MAQFSVKIIRLNGAVLDENQQSEPKNLAILATSGNVARSKQL
jgi:hypothetical protein